ncbi:MAG: hypothetical protein ACFHX7_00225 [Pseudomonadota bacterium]
MKILLTLFVFWSVNALAESRIVAPKRVDGGYCIEAIRVGSDGPAAGLITLSSPVATGACANQQRLYVNRDQLDLINAGNNLSRQFRIRCVVREFDRERAIHEVVALEVRVATLGQCNGGLQE